MTATSPRLDTFHLILCVLGGVVLLFIVAPLAGLVFDSSIAEIAETTRDEEVRQSIWLTIWVAMAATFLTSFGAVPLAYLLARKSFPFKKVVSAIIDIPIVIPHSAAGIAVLGVLSRDSWLGGAAERIGIVFIGHSAGIMAAMAFVSVPFLVNAARHGFLAVPVRLEKAALNLGASPARVFFTISVPMARRAIGSGFVLMWGRGMSEFGAVMIIAYHPMVTPVLLWERFGAFGLSYARPLAIVIIAICLGAFVLFRILTEGDDHAHR